MAIYILYKTTNLKDNKYYIGYHKQKDGYSANEFDGYLGSGERLKNAIIKHGESNFIRETLAAFDTDRSASDAERDYITEEMILDINCYNMGPGGHGGDIKSEDGKRRTSEKLKGDNNPMKKFVITEEWRNKVSEGTKRGQQNSEKYKEAHLKNIEIMKSDKNPGKNKSDETKKKISESKKGKPGLHGEKNGMYGKELSEEHKQALFKGASQARLNEPTYYCKACDRYIKTNGNWHKHQYAACHLKNVEKIKTQ